MKKYLLVGLSLFVLFMMSRSADAQSIATHVPSRVVVNTLAPIFVKPDTTMTPLRVAREGSALNAIASEGDWYRVEFQDPQWGRRIGYVEKRHVTALSTPSIAEPPVDLTIAEVGRTLGPEADLRSPSTRATATSGQAPTAADAFGGYSQTREGFWFNAGLGYGSLGCDDCNRLGGLSGNLSLGGTISPRVLLGVGTTGWYRSDTEGTLGTVDARLRFYPSLTSGFFVTGGLGLGHISGGFDTEYGLGAVLGLGWDLRVGRNVSLTPFWNGFAMRSDLANANVGQLGIGITIH